MKTEHGYDSMMFFIQNLAQTGIPMSFRVPYRPDLELNDEITSYIADILVVLNLKLQISARAVLDSIKVKEEKAVVLTKKGKEIMSSMKKEYGAKKGKQVFYASENKGTIKGVHKGKKRGK